MVTYLQPCLSPCLPLQPCLSPINLLAYQPIAINLAYQSNYQPCLSPKTSLLISIKSSLLIIPPPPSHRALNRKG